MARIGEEGKHQRVQIDVSELCEKVEEFPPEKCQIEFEMWTNKWKGGLRIHEAIVQERTAANYASASNTRSDESRGKEIAADDSTSTSEKPPIDSEVQEVMLDTVGPELQVINKTENSIPLQEDNFTVLSPDLDREATSSLLSMNFTDLSTRGEDG
uniref:Uncharacterized protein n=1 Tax=Populus alba TaxID=43335 RepID=A0A4U5PS70_POPAL|nr:hypothetical protein D5086_0000188870 [Populus alba]